MDRFGFLAIQYHSGGIWDGKMLDAKGHAFVACNTKNINNNAPICNLIQQ